MTKDIGYIEFGPCECGQQGIKRLVIDNRQEGSYEYICDDCDELDGTTAPINGSYAGGADGPPLHPNCRCTEGISGSYSEDDE